MQLFTICFCNIFAPKKTKKKPNQSTNQKKKSKLDGIQKKKRKQKEK